MTTPARFRRFSIAFGHHLGQIEVVGARWSYPLHFHLARAFVAERFALAGDSAHGIHPIAGQGLNLGLRDAWDLARTLADAPDPGDPARLAGFAAQRRLDARATIHITDFLAAGFAGANPLVRAARGAALTALDIFPAPRRFFARRMMFGAQALP